MELGGHALGSEDDDCAVSMPDGYMFSSVLGRGASGVVMRAHDKHLRRDVAIKTLHSKNATKQVLQRFRKEATILSTLKHPNIVEVLVYGVTENNCPYMVMTFIDGKRLSDLIAEMGKIPIDTTVRMFLQICDGMVHAHRNGILHRDLKPDNVMLVNPDTPSPMPIIVDFGVGKLQHSDKDGALTTKGSIIGTPIYMSPEQLLSKPVDARSDIYSMGCMILECLTGAKPFEGQSVLDIAQKKQQGNVRSMESLEGDDLSNSLKEIVRKCLAPNAIDRFQSMVELKGALELLTFSHDRADTPSSEANRDTEPNAPKGALAALVCILVIGLVSFVAWQLVGLLEAPRLPEHPRLDVPRGELPTEPIGIDKLKVKAGVLVHIGITDEQLRSLTNRRDLRVLKLTDMRGSGVGFESLKDLPIEDIDIDYGILSDAGLKALCKVKSLKSLGIRGCARVAPLLTELEALPDLTLLTLESCSMTDDSLKVLPGLKQLKSLDLTKNPAITDRSLETIGARFPNLKHLGLGRTGVTIEAICRYVIEKPGLRFISFRNDGNLINDAALEKLAALPLAGIEVPKCASVTDRGVLALVRMKSLKLLNIYNCPKVTEGAVKEFKQRRPDCELGFLDSRDRLDVH